MTRFLYRIGRWCAEHGWQVIVAWILVVLAVGGLNRGIGGAAAEEYNLPGTDGAIAQDLLYRAFPGSAGEANPVVLYSDTIDFTSPSGSALVAAVAAAEREIPEVTSVVAPADRPELVSDDGHTALVQVTVVDRYAGDASTARRILDTARATAGSNVEVSLGGFLGRSISRPSTRSSEALGLAAAVLVLLITLRRPLAALIPLVNALVSVGLGLALVGLLGKLVFIPDVAPTLGTMLGLGVGIDYALFLVTRHRMLMRQGFEVADSVGRTAGTAGAAMVFAGGTLIAAVGGLVLTGLSFLAWLGIAAGTVVAVAVIASVTLVPALLGVMGRQVIPSKYRELVTDDAQALDSSRWAKLATAVTSRPWLFAVTSTVVLLVMAAPTLTLSLGHSDASTLPTTTTARQAEDFMREGFGAGESAPLAVVSQMFGPATSPESETAGATPTKQSGDPRVADPRLMALRADLQATPGVVRVDEPVVSTDGGVATMRVIPQWGSSDPRTEALVHDLRDRVLPAADEGAGMSSHVGGITALNIDLSELIAQRTPWFIAGVVALAFLLLMLAYRSLLIPFKAAAMNLLSIAAAYGVVTAVFQWGWGATFIGLAGPVPIDSYVPMMIFAVLFGLSMDYEVFLLTAFREQWERTGDMTIAVRRGLADTGRVVTAAALIMVVVFGSFILSTDPTVKIFGVGLATAVAVDATIVRCLLVPAIMVLAQRGTWWLPGWLDRLLPHVHVEGDPAAISTATEQRPQRSAQSAALVRRNPWAALGALIGALVGVLGVGLVTAWQEPVALVVSAVAGAVAVVFTVGGGSGRPRLGQRVFGLVLGAALALIASGIAAAFTPATSDTPDAIEAGAVLVVALLLVLGAPRAMALPALLGSISVAVAVLTLSATDAVSIMTVSVLPALVAAIIAAAVSAMGYSRASEPVDVSEPMDVLS